MDQNFNGFWEFYIRVKFRLQYITIIKKHKSENAKDMDQNFNGFWEFYIRVKFRLQYITIIKKHKSENAKVIIMSPHWLHLDRCVRLCSACNSPEKTRVFREAVELAASCEGVEYYDPSQLIKIVSDTSKVSIDGILASLRQVCAVMLSM